MSEYLTTTEVLQSITYSSNATYGGTHGLRDIGALDSALYRPQSGFYENVLEEAAALWESLTTNHPFLDGNKRVGFAVADVFLRMYGYRITADPETIWEFIDNSFRNNEFEYSNLLSFLKRNTINS